MWHFFYFKNISRLNQAVRFVFPIGHANDEEEDIDEPDEPSSVNNESEAHVENEASKVLSLPQYVSEEFEISVAIQRRAKAYRALLKEVDACRELKRRCVILNAIRRYITCSSTIPIVFVKCPHNIVFKCLSYENVHNYTFKSNMINTNGVAVLPEDYLKYLHCGKTIHLSENDWIVFAKCSAPYLFFSRIVVISADCNSIVGMSCFGSPYWQNTQEGRIWNLPWMYTGFGAVIFWLLKTITMIAYNSSDRSSIINYMSHQQFNRFESLPTPYNLVHYHYIS